MDTQVEAPDELLPLIIVAIIVLTPIILVSVFIYRRTKRRLHLQNVIKEVKKAQIDLGILRDIEKD